MPPNELSLLLIGKADQDIYILEKLATESDAPLEAYGFHAQQATEKLIKAVLAARGVAYTRTHRLGELVDLAADSGVRFPSGIEALVDLTPYAVEYRYDAAPDEGYDELDKQDVLAKVRTLHDWATRQVSAT